MEASICCTHVDTLHCTLMHQMTGRSAVHLHTWCMPCHAKCTGCAQVGDAIMLNRGIVPATWFLWMSVGIIFAWIVIFGIETWALSEYLNREPLPLVALQPMGAPARLPCHRICT